MKRFIIILIGIVFCILQVVAQTYGIKYYISAGAELNDNTSVTVIYFDGNKVIQVATKSASYISGDLSKNRDFYKELAYKMIDKNRVYKYNSKMTTSKSVVFNRPYNTAQFFAGGIGFPPRTDYVYAGDNYLAFQNNYTVMISWSQGKDSNTIKDKRYYQQVDVESLIVDPYDFLN